MSNEQVKNNDGKQEATQGLNTSNVTINDAGRIERDNLSDSELESVSGGSFSLGGQLGNLANKAIKDTANYIAANPKCLSKP